MLDWLTTSLMPHLILAPILLPMFTAAVMLLLREEHLRLKVVLNIASTAIGLCIAVALLQWSDEQAGPSAMGVYLAANWKAPFGIVLALDRLSAMMLVLTYCWPQACSPLPAGTRQGCTSTRCSSSS